MTREQKEFTLALIICGGFFLWIAKDLYETVTQDPIPKTKIEVVYDCRLAEISPDYPVMVKEKCRKLMTPKIGGVS